VGARPTDRYHWVTVDGYIDTGTNNETLVVHDPLYANGNNCWTIDANGSFSTPVGTAACAVAESIPEPETTALLGLALRSLASIWQRRSHGIVNR
jgi:hypothetical protein